MASYRTTFDTCIDQHMQQYSYVYVIMQICSDATAQGDEEGILPKNRISECGHVSAGKHISKSTNMGSYRTAFDTCIDQPVQ